MAITEGTQPAALTWTGAWTAGQTTASFTPEAGALLVALLAGDGSGAGTTTGAITDSLSGSWTLLKRQNFQDGTLGGTCEVWCRDSPGASLTVTATGSGSAANGGQLVVRTLIGAKATASQNGATGGAAFDPAAAVQVSVAAGTGGKIYGAAFNFDNSTVMTPLGNTTVVNAFSDTVNGDTWEAFKSTGDTAGTATYGYSTSHIGQIAAVEILAAPAAGGLSVARPGKTWNRRFHHRQQLLAPPPAPTVTVDLGWLSIQTPRRRGIRRQRGSTVSPIFVQVAAPAAPTYVQDPGRHWLRGSLPRRARIARPVDVQSAPPPPVPDRPPLRPRLWRRTRSAAVISDQAQPQPPARPRRVVAWRRRPQAPTPVPAQVTPPTPPAYPWQALGQRRRGAWRRRPQAPSPVPAQQAPPTPPPYPVQVRTPKRVMNPFRRGRHITPTPPQTAPIPALIRRRFTLPGKRRQQVTPIPPQIVVTPPTYPRQPVRRRIIALLLRRPGRLRFPTQPGAIITRGSITGVIRNAGIATQSKRDAGAATGSGRVAGTATGSGRDNAEATESDRNAGGVT